MSTPALQQPAPEHWHEPSQKNLTSRYWDDPFPELQGMLTAEYIVRYHEAIGGGPPDSDDGDSRGMIRPLRAELLKPAGYELTLGPRCLVQGQDRLLSDREPSLIIPKNAIAFVSMEQVLCLPHYLVARFDLTIDLIYRGLLLGAGPQVDPRYQGGLSCPLHNISDDEIEIRLGEPFAKMDFVKTVPRDPEIARRLSNITSERDLAIWLAKDAPPTQRLFKRGAPTWREPIFGYLNGRRPRSSLRKLSDEITYAVKAVKTLRNLSPLGILAVAAAIAALVFAALQLTNGLSTVKTELQSLRACQQSLAAQIEADRRSAASRVPLALPLRCSQP